MLFRQKDNFLTKCTPIGSGFLRHSAPKITGPQLCIHHRPAGGVLFGQPCKGVGHRQCGSLQEGKGILLRPQQVEIGRQGGEGIGRIAQSGIHGQAAHPCPWIAHGGQAVQQLRMGGAGTHGGFQPVLQTFRNAPHLGKRRGSCAPAAQKRQLTALGGRKIGVLPGGKGFPVERQDFRRNIGSRSISSAALPERAQGAGTGKLPPVSVRACP